MVLLSPGVNTTIDPPKRTYRSSGILQTTNFLQIVTNAVGKRELTHGQLHRIRRGIQNRLGLFDRRNQLHGQGSVEIGLG